MITKSYHNNDFLNTAINAIETASDIILKASTPFIKEYKSKTDLVTNIDLKSEQIIKEIISSKFPTHSILAEESGLANNNSEFCWIIDPLDGTTNFVHDYPSYGISIALYENGVPLIAAVKELPIGNLYTAIKGSGAYCNNIKINTSYTKTLSSSLLVTGFGYNHGDNWQKNMKLFKEFTDRTQGVRRLGSASIDFCHLACGKVDAFWEYDLKPWDVAAGFLIATESGCLITKLNGDEYSIYDNQVLATNSLIHQEMISIINKTI